MYGPLSAMWCLCFLICCLVLSWSFLGGFLGGKDSACNAGDLVSIPGLGRSSGESNSNPLQYSCLENSMNRRFCWSTVHGVANSQTWLSNFHFHLLGLSELFFFFSPKSKCLLISWLQSLSAVILEAKKIKSATVSFFFFPICLPWSNGTRCHDHRVLNIEF